MLECLRNIHWHNHRPIAVEHFEGICGGTNLTVDEILQATKIGIRKHQTRILRRCDCGDLKVEMLDGTWTIEQITG